MFTFVYLKFVNSGYLMVLLPPACVWLGFWAADWYEQIFVSPPLRRIGLVVAAAAINGNAIFLRAPLYFSHREVQRFEPTRADLQR